MAVVLIQYRWLCAGFDWQQSVKSIGDVKEQQLCKTYADIGTSDMPHCNAPRRLPASVPFLGGRFIQNVTPWSIKFEKLIVGQTFSRVLWSHEFC